VISPLSTWESIVAVLPVAAVEQHGPHLPVRVDAAINTGILAAPSQ
jgi:creatinine amidohydrolase